MAVDNVDLELAPGEIVSVLGPSGCGKTSLLRLIAGFEQVDSGEILINGALESSASVHKAPDHRHLGMVFQEYALFPHMTVAQNITFGLKKMAADDRKRRLGEMLELVDLTSLEKRYPHELSGGQQQRVALARTLAPSPIAVLLDEPFSNLDAEMRSVMRSDVESILRSHEIGTIFVTHDRDEAFTMADRVGVMRNGKMDQIDSPEAVYQNPISLEVARLTGTCDFIPGVSGPANVVTEIGTFPSVCGADSLASGIPVEVLVRPDDFRVAPDPNGKCTVKSREFRGDETVLTIETSSGALIRCRQRTTAFMSLGASVTLIPSKDVPFVVYHRE